MNVHPASVLGQSLRQWRKESSLSLKHVAGEIGVSLSIVSGWEGGKRFPSGINIERISSYTRIPLPCLFCRNSSVCRNAGYVPCT